MLAVPNKANEAEQLKIDFILCTRNRLENVLKLLESMNRLTSCSLAEVTIVDSSDVPITINKNDYSEIGSINLEFSKPGLPSQRNLGLSSTRNPIVVFLDDDVVLAQNFISATLEEFSKNHEIAGLGYLLQGVQFTERKIFKAISSKVKVKEYGQVTKTGKNFWYPELGEADKYKSPMWLPGCAMAFRRVQIEKKIFNPVLEKGILGGYALGEDVDFTLSLLKEGKRFGLCHTTIVNHYEAPGERDNTIELARAQGHWLNYLSKSHKNFVRRNWVISRLFGEFVYLKLAKYFNRGSLNAQICSRERLFNFLGSSPYSKQN